jgi:hypothetical protein
MFFGLREHSLPFIHFKIGPYTIENCEQVIKFLKNAGESWKLECLSL